MNDIDSLLVKLLAVRVVNLEMALSNLNVAEYQRYAQACAPDIKVVFDEYKSLEHSEYPAEASLYRELKDVFYAQFSLADSPE